MSKKPEYRVTNILNVETNKLVGEVEVDSYAGLEAYKPESGEKTIVIPTAACSKEDLSKIKSYCTQHGMVLDLRHVDVNDLWSESSSSSSSSSDDSYVARAPRTTNGGRVGDDQSSNGTVK